MKNNMDEVILLTKSNFLFANKILRTKLNDNISIYKYHYCILLEKNRGGT